MKAYNFLNYAYCEKLRKQYNSKTERDGERVENPRDTIQ